MDRYTEDERRRSLALIHQPFSIIPIDQTGIIMSYLTTKQRINESQFVSKEFAKATKLSFLNRDFGTDIDFHLIIHRDTTSPIFSLKIAKTRNHVRSMIHYDHLHMFDVPEFAGHLFSSVL